MMLSAKHGIGEVYRVRAQVDLVEKIKSRYNIESVVEYPPDEISADFPITWKQVETPKVKADLLLTWRAFPEIVAEIVENFRNYILLISTNPLNIGTPFLKLWWNEIEAYFTKNGLEEMATNYGLQVVDSGYYDCPPWPDAPLPSRFGHIKMKSSKIYHLTLLDRCNFLKSIRAHHAYVLAKGEGK